MPLYIENFGPIISYSTDLSKSFNIIIGEQATGKSTIAKSVYFCKKIRDFLFDYLSDQTRLLSLHPSERYIGFLKYCRQKFISCFGTTKHMGEFAINYKYSGNKWVAITLGNDKYAKFRFSPELRNGIAFMIQDATNLYSDYINRSDNLYSIYIRFQDAFANQLQKAIQLLFEDDSDIIYIPAGRSIMSLISDHISAFPEIDMPTNDFIDRISIVKRRYGGKLSDIIANYTKIFSGQINNKKVDMALELVNRILKADYSNDSDGEKLYFDDRRWVHLRFGSSGQQESLWILIILLVAVLEKRKSFVIIEEPEAHLFPTAQNAIVKLISLMRGATDSTIFVTTHSPYIISSINLLMFSAKVEGKHQNESNVVESDYRIPASTVSAMYIERRESSLSFMDIIDKEESMIDTRFIDSLSAYINSEIDLLIEKEVNRYDVH